MCVCVCVMSVTVCEVFKDKNQVSVNIITYYIDTTTQRNKFITSLLHYSHRCLQHPPVLHCLCLPHLLSGLLVPGADEVCVFAHDRATS